MLGADNLCFQTKLEQTHARLSFKTCRSTNEGKQGNAEGFY